MVNNKHLFHSSVAVFDVLCNSVHQALEDGEFAVVWFADKWSIKDVIGKLGACMRVDEADECFSTDCWHRVPKRVAHQETVSHGNGGEEK